MDYCHIYTKGLEHKLLFQCEEDFIYGMNLIPRYLQEYSLRLLAFCLMDNHVHFVTGGDMAASGSFIFRFVKTLSTYSAKKYGADAKERIIPGISRINTAERLPETIAYVLRNPVAAGARHIPQDYRWSSASLYFRSANRSPESGIRKLSTISTRERRVLLKRKSGFSDEWYVDSAGMISPSCYTETAFVEKLFGSVKRYMYYLSAGKEEEIGFSMEMNGSIRLSDAELKKEAMKICLDLHGSAELNLIDLGRRLHICRILRRKFGATFRQIGRIMNMDAAYLKSIM